VTEATIAYDNRLDGIRAIAVISVILFHLRPSWLPGGYLGVDIFFTLSGYLITSIVYRIHYKDKGKKLLTGLWRARHLNPSHFFIFDADDLVSNQISGFLNAQSPRTSWFVDAGFAINFQTGRLQRKHGLVRYCGTSLAPSASALFHHSVLKEAYSKDFDEDRLIRETPGWFISQVIGDHRCTPGYFRSIGNPMQALPFRASVWVQQNGENQVKVNGVLTGISASTGFCEEFGVNGEWEPPRFSGSLIGSTWETLNCLTSWVGAKHYRMMGHPLPNAD
jgi:hypothetical protein